MSQIKLRSAQYFDPSPDELPSGRRRSGRACGRVSAKRGGFLFRSVLISGIGLCIYLFYKNQDPFLANIRDNSEHYSLLFSDLVKQVKADGMNVILDSDDTVTNDLANPPETP